MTALSNRSFAELQSDCDFWGRLVESSVGAHLVNDAKSKHIEVFYWLNRNREVDFILRLGKTLTAIEVKSTAKSYTLPGMETFCKMFPVKRRLLVGGQGIPLDEFLATPTEHLLK